MCFSICLFELGDVYVVFLDQAGGNRHMIYISYIVICGLAFRVVFVMYDNLVVCLRGIDIYILSVFESSIWRNGSSHRDI